MSLSNFVPIRRLPAEPNLEQLRKQAKELLEAYRSGKTDAVTEVHRFEQSPGDFALSDAQRVLARSYGFASWPKLKAFVDGANIRRFMEAVKTGAMHEVRSMLASRPELVGMDTAENDEHRAIHYAVLARNIPMTRLLMEAGSDARKGIFPQRDATTAFALAKERGYDEIVAIIEDEERHRREELSCLNATVSERQDQISLAIARGDRKQAIHLLESDFSQIHACDRNGRSPLHVAALRLDQELLEWLLERRAKVRKPDAEGWTPLDLAAKGADPRNDTVSRFPEIAALLMRYGAELTVSGAVALGDTGRVREMIAEEPSWLRRIGQNGGLLKLAVLHGQIDMVQMLLDLGADVNERITLEQLEEPVESWGMPLWHAALAGNYTMCELLLNRGADPNANVYASGWPLMNAYRGGHEAVKRLLMQRGAKMQPYILSNAHDVAGAKAILAQDATERDVEELVWSAADAGCAEILEAALPFQNWPKDDSRWHWVLMQPIRGASNDPRENDAYFQCLHVLLEYGINPNVVRMGQSALHFTAGRGGLAGSDRARFAAMLLDHGADLHLRDDLLKSTALGWACRWGRKEMVELLLSRGAPVDESGAEPWATPMAWARKMGHHEIERILEQAR